MNLNVLENISGELVLVVVLEVSLGEALDYNESLGNSATPYYRQLAREFESEVSQCSFI